MIATPYQKRTASAAEPSSAFDAGLSAELDRVEAAITGVEVALRPLWAAARKSPAVARVVAESMRAMADLRRERGIIEERLGI